MSIQKRLVQKVIGLATFYGIILTTAVIFYVYTASPYKIISFQIMDFEYDSETGYGYQMLDGNGTIYAIEPILRQEFAASDFFYDTLYNDTVEVWVKKSTNEKSKNILVYGVICNGKVYLEPQAPKANRWWVFVVIGFFVAVTAIIKALQLYKVRKTKALWQQRSYIMGLYDKHGDFILIPCSTTSYLYPNVEMMESFYAVNRSQTTEEFAEHLKQAFLTSYQKLANPSKLEVQLKSAYGVRSLKEFMQYQKILYIVRDEKDGYYIRKMKSVLPAPEKNVYEIITEGHHLQLDVTEQELVSSILKEAVYLTK